MKVNHQATSCGDVQKELLRLFDQKSLGQLPAAVARHLETCPKCRKALSELQQLERSLERIPAQVPDERYWVNFLPKLRQRMDQAPIIPRKRDLAWAVSAVAALVFVFFLLQQPTAIAPPSWYYSGLTVQTGTGTDFISGDGLTNQDYILLSQVFSDSSGNTDINKTEMQLIEEFSARTRYVSDDPIDRLVGFDEQSFDHFLEELKKRPVITS